MTSITGNTYNLVAGDANYDTTKVGKNEIEIVVPLKLLSNLWRTLNILLINCEIELVLTWSKNCLLANMIPAITAPAGLVFQITDAKLYAPVTTLSKENEKRLSEQLKSEFKRTAKWNKYRSQMTIPRNNYNLNYLIDPTFTKVNRLFVLSFERS